MSSKQPVSKFGDPWVFLTFRMEFAMPRMDLMSMKNLEKRKAESGASMQRALRFSD